MLIWENYLAISSCGGLHAFSVPSGNASLWSVPTILHLSRKGIHRYVRLGVRSIDYLGIISHELRSVAWVKRPTAKVARLNAHHGLLKVQYRWFFRDDAMRLWRTKRRRREEENQEEATSLRCTNMRWFKNIWLILLICLLFGDFIVFALSLKLLRSRALHSPSW